MHHEVGHGHQEVDTGHRRSPFEEEGFGASTAPSCRRERAVTWGLRAAVEGAGAGVGAGGGGAPVGVGSGGAAPGPEPELVRVRMPPSAEASVMVRVPAEVRVLLAPVLASVRALAPVRESVPASAALMSLGAGCY